MRLPPLFIIICCVFSIHTAQAINCDLVYDEFDHLMNKSFLTNPGNYVKTKSKRLSRQHYNARQKNSFLLNKENQGYGIAIVQSNRGLHGKLLFTWGRPIQSGHPSLIIGDSD